MDVCLVCMQESAKAALKMKDCQMTDRTTQTEHMGPEVRLHITKWGLALTKVFTASPFLLHLPVCDNAFYAEPQQPVFLPFLPSFLSHIFKSISSRWAKALIHLTLSKDVVLQWHSYYSPLPAPPLLHPIPTVLGEGAVLLPMPTLSVDMASLASLGADSMGT